MEKHNKYAAIGLKALRRAALKVAEDAKKNNYKMPIWRDGHIEYEIPEIATEQQSHSIGYDQRSSLPINRDGFQNETNQKNF